MHGKISLSDFRCFTAQFPATFELRPGFTAFIGPNNAGKSTLLRSMYELRPAFQEAINGLRGNARGFLANRSYKISLPPPVSDPSEIISERSGAGLEFQLSVAQDGALSSPFVQTARWTYTENGLVNLTFLLNDGRALGEGEDELRVTGASPTCYVLEEGAHHADFSQLLNFLEIVYGLQYVGPFRNAINEGSGSHYDLALGTSFVGQWHQWKTGGSKRENRAVLRVTEDVRRLIGAKTLEINASIELKTLQVSIDGRPHKLSELGAGIAQLIVVLGNALVRRPTFIAIDEPETHLHPSLQLDFLSSLASYASHGILFTTHSIGLARTADRCYSIQATDKGSIVRPFDRTPRYAEFLGSLGIAALQEIGWDHILLVEGTTDVRTFQQFLRTLGLDRRVVVLPLGGDSMIHGGTAPQLEEIVRLGNRVLAVIDSERKSSNEEPARQRKAFAANCEALSIQCLLTERRATENYLSDRAVKAAFGSQSNQLGPFDAAPVDQRFWGKASNWKAAKEMNREELLLTDIGRFLDQIPKLP